MHRYFPEKANSYQFDLDHYPWIWHPEHGWNYSFGGDQRGWFYDGAQRTYWFSGADLYPYIYTLDWGWTYYVPGNAGSRWFYSFDFEKWLEMKKGENENDS